MSDEIKKGLLGIVVDETTISQVMPEINSLTYRGYTVQELCDKCCFEEVVYLVINGELPNKKQLKKFIKEERSNRKLSRQILKDIQSGKFAKQWMDENKNGQKNFLKMRKELAEHPIEKVGKKLRALMPWIGKNKLVDKEKN